MEVRSVLFDAGNTLVELDYRGLADRFCEEGFVASAGQVREATGVVRPRLDAFLAGGRRSSEAGDTRELFLNLVLDALGVEDARVQRRLSRRLGGALADLLYLPAEGARDTLALLRFRGMGLAVVSNSDGRIAELFAKNGLLDYVDTVVDSGVEGVEKPDPRIFETALERLGARPATAVHVGDLPSVDVAGARAAGITPVLLDPFDGFPDVEAARIRSLAELPPLLETL